MPQVNLNLDDVKDYVEEGWYLLRVVDAEIKEGNAGEYINWRLEIQEVEEDVPPVYHVTSFSVPSMVRNFLKACNFQWNDDGSFHTEDVLGCELEAKLTIGEYQGNKRNEIDKMRPL